MNNVARITDVDISRQVRPLAWLRWTQYALVFLCGYGALGSMWGLVFSLPSADAGTLVFYLIASLILGFTAYTGWRHYGVIDATVWRSDRVVLPVFVVFYLFIGPLIALALPTESVGERAEAEILVVYGVCIGSAALLGWISLMLVRRMNITAIGATVDQVLSRLAKNAGVTALQTGGIKRINKPRGLVLATAGALLLLASTIPIPDTEKSKKSGRGGYGRELALLGFFVLTRARQYFQVDADSLLTADRRPPMLFLRSFGDDEKETYRGSKKAFLDFSLEARLSNHFSRFSPFVAIGSPYDPVPQFGAARVHLSDDEWQPRVLSWIRGAKAIIMYSGTTHWINWELRQVVKNERATRLILMIPEIRALLWARKEEISARVEQVREGFSGTLWEEELLCFNDFARLRVMLFRSDGSMVTIKSRSKSRDSYHLAALLAHYILNESDALKKAGTVKPGPSLDSAGRTI